MASVQGKKLTIDDIYALPEGQRAELIDGQLYMVCIYMDFHICISDLL